MVDVTEAKWATIVARKEDFVGLLYPYWCFVGEGETRIRGHNPDRGVVSENVQKPRVKNLEEWGSCVGWIEELGE